MNKTPFVFLIAIPLIISCGVKPRDAGTNPLNLPGTKGGNLPSGTLVSKESKFFAYPSKQTYEVGEEKIIYSIVTQSLEPFPKDYLVTVKYWMPEMPDMPVTPTTPTYPESGKVQVVYDISMGGTWAFELYLSKAGGSSDVLSYTAEVP